jgi:hypothetical protein
MIPAPFSGTEAARVLSALAAIFFALGGLAWMVAGPRRYARRALLVGLILAGMAGAAGQVFS